MTLRNRLFNAAGLLCQAIDSKVDRRRVEEAMDQIRRAIEDEVSRLEGEVKSLERRLRE